MFRVKNLHKTFYTDRDIVKAVDGVDFDIESGKIFTLLGPSGCGKTTTLRLVAGLEEADSGEIVVEDRVAYSSEKRINVPPNQRAIGMVFQSYAIWPNMNVFENVAFPLRVSKQKFSRAQIREKTNWALSIVELDGMQKRPAPRLSGGQQQRLALARALVNRPKILLLDEPLSNLDANLREQMRIELKKLQRSIGITTLYVTHDQIEALALSDTIAVMNEGRIIQMAEPRQIYQKPDSPFVAGFIGTTNFIPGKVTGGGVETRYGLLTCIIPDNIMPGDEVALSIRPEHIDLIPAETEKPNILKGKIEISIFLGEFLDCQVTVDDMLFRCRVNPSNELDVGMEVWVHLPPNWCTVLRR